MGRATYLWGLQSTHPFWGLNRLLEAEVAVQCKAADGGHCLSGRKEMVQIAWLIPQVQP